MSDLLRSVEQQQLKENPPQFSPGDTVRVHLRIIEGDRERVQVFEGVVMRLRHGGVNTTFTVRRVTHGVGVERTFLLHSPRVEKVDIVRQGRVRRAQLYYLRQRVGEAARVKEKRPMRGAAAPRATARPAPASAAPTDVAPTGAAPESAAPEG